jgi:6-phosphogluconolactonase
MIRTTRILLTVVLAIGTVLPALSNTQTDGNAAAGAVFVMTNSAGHNEIIAYKRGPDGSLEEGQSFQTGGRGSSGVTRPFGIPGFSHY